MKNEDTKPQDLQPKTNEIDQNANEDWEEYSDEESNEDPDPNSLSHNPSSTQANQTNPSTTNSYPSSPSKPDSYYSSPYNYNTHHTSYYPKKNYPKNYYNSNSAHFPKKKYKPKYENNDYYKKDYNEYNNNHKDYNENEKAYYKKDTDYINNKIEKEENIIKPVFINSKLENNGNPDGNFKPLESLPKFNFKSIGEVRINNVYNKKNSETLDVEVEENKEGYKEKFYQFGGNDFYYKNDKYYDNGYNRDYYYNSSNKYKYKYESGYNGKFLNQPKKNDYGKFNSSKRNMNKFD